MAFRFYQNFLGCPLKRGFSGLWIGVPIFVPISHVIDYQNFIIEKRLIKCSESNRGVRMWEKQVIHAKLKVEFLI